MSREWQQTRFPEYVMPDAVYYQSIWAVRDLVRMENRLEELNEGRDLSVHSHSIVMDGGGNSEISRPTEKYAVEKVLLEGRVTAIHDALDVVPDAFRGLVLSNIIMQKSGRDYPNKMWKYWKQRFLYGVAKNLQLLA
ncbi:MAG: hypothetical protein Q4E84_07985 [Clostridia bacterium]|nr:hypothetical protein [Clostridia bacterium]MDO5303814.1 hypothetical protein [Clostridia bacterium]